MGTRTTTTTELVLHFLACWRLCQLAIRDRITLPIRGRLIRWAYQRADDAPAGDMDDLTLGEWDELARADDDAPYLVTLATCWWCAGWWIAVAWTAAAWVWPAGWWWASVALAASVLIVAGADLLALLGRLAK